MPQTSEINDSNLEQNATAPLSAEVSALDDKALTTNQAPSMIEKIPADSLLVAKIKPTTTKIAAITEVPKNALPRICEAKSAAPPKKNSTAKIQRKMLRKLTGNTINSTPKSISANEEIVAALRPALTFLLILSNADEERVFFFFTAFTITIILYKVNLIIAHYERVE